jgi:hypothetical protein
MWKKVTRTWIEIRPKKADKTLKFLAAGLAIRRLS